MRPIEYEISARRSGVIDGQQSGLEVLDGARIARGRRRASEPGEDVGASRAGRGLGQGALVIAHGRGGRSAGQGTFGGGLQRVDHPLLAPGLAHEQVGSDLLGHGLLGSQQRRRAGVQASALGGGQLGVDGRPDDRVDEGERLARPQDLGRRERIGGLARHPRFDLRQLRRAPQRSAVAQHRRRPGERGRAELESGESQQHGARDGLGAELAHPHGAGRVGRRALDLQRGQELLHEQRVAAGDVGARRGEPRGHVVEERGAHEPVDRRAGERLQDDPFGGLVPGELGQEVRVHPGVARATRDHRGDRQLGEPLGEIQEEAQRRGVRPMHVVDRQQERPVVRDVGGQPVEAVQQREDVILAPATGRRLGAIEQRGRESRGTVEEPLALGPVGRRQHGLEQLERDAEGEVPFQLAARGRQGPHTAALGESARGGEELGFPQPCVALDDEEAAPALPGRIQGGP